MDCNMPVLDGYEATHAIRSFVHSKGLPQPIIIAVTGHTEEEYVKKVFECGMNELSPKPVDAQLLGDVLKKLEFV